MQSKWKQTLTLGGIVILLGAYFLLYEKDRPTDEQLQATKNDVALFAGKTFDALEIINGSSTTSLEKKQNGWVITAPEEKEAEQAAVEAIVKQIIDMKATSSIIPTPPITQENFGLKEVTKKIKVRETGATSFTEIALGKENPLGTGIYISIGTNQTVYSVPLAITSVVDSTVETLRFKSPTPTATATSTPQPTNTPPPAAPDTSNQGGTTPVNGS